MDVAGFFLALAAILAGAKLLGESPSGWGSPRYSASWWPACCSAGVGLVPHEGAPGEVLHVLAELGVVLLVFEIGLETDLREMLRVGPASLAVALVGVFVPFGLGYVYWAFLKHPAGGDVTTSAIFIGATLTATSVGITARVLSDLGQLGTREARVIIGAAVIDDVLGLVILTVVSGLAAGAAITVLGVVRALAVAVGFLVIAVVAGRAVMPRLFDLVVRMRARYVLLLFAVAFVLGLSAAAALAGLGVSNTMSRVDEQHHLQPVSSLEVWISLGPEIALTR